MMTIKPGRKTVSESLEDYLEAIWFLTQRQGEVHNKDLARELGVTMPSVTAALRHLQELGYIDYDRRTGPRLTESGECLARQVADRHLLLKEFFSSILLLPPAEAEALACNLEHVIGPEASVRLANLTAYLKDRCFQCDMFDKDRYARKLAEHEPGIRHSCDEQSAD